MRSLTSAVLLVMASSSVAIGDAEIRLYRGANEFDLQEKIVIDRETGKTLNIKYRKSCGAHGGCAALEVSRTEAAAVSAEELAELKAAVDGIDPNASKKEGDASKTSICELFQRFSYVAVKQGGRTVPVLEIKSGCKGLRLNSPASGTIERVLNVAASNVGI